MLVKLRRALVRSADRRNLAVDAVTRHGARAADLLIARLSDPDLDDDERVAIAHAVPIARAVAASS